MFFLTWSASTKYKTKWIFTGTMLIRSPWSIWYATTCYKMHNITKREWFETIWRTYHLYRTITKYDLATIFHCLFICHTKLRTRKNLKLTGDLAEGKDVNFRFRELSFHQRISLIKETCLCKKPSIKYSECVLFLLPRFYHVRHGWNLQKQNIVPLQNMQKGQPLFCDRIVKYIWICDISTTKHSILSKWSTCIIEIFI